jgi:glycosyltransferase involved in cell wall biosynthesis
MKLMVVGTRGFPDVQGGIERHCERLYPRLVPRGCEVTVLVRTPYIPSAKRMKEWQGVRFIHVWSPHNKYLEAVIHTFFGIIIARLHSPDLLHIHAIGPSLLAPFARLMGLKVIMTHHGPDYQRKKWGCCAKFMLKLGEWMGVFCARRVIVVSQSVREYLIERFKRYNLVFIPNGVDAVTGEPGISFLHTFKLKPQKYVLAVGRFVPEKGLHDLIAAYDRLAPCTSKLVIVGGADHETRYSRQLKTMANKNPDIILTGILHHEDLYCLYNNAQVFVLPSYYEGLPLALLEALSYGCEVIASNIPATREIPLNTDAYFQAGDIDALTMKIQKALDISFTPEQRAYYKNLVKETYNWDRIADKTYALLKNRRKYILNTKTQMPIE